MNDGVKIYPRFDASLRKDARGCSSRDLGDSRWVAGSELVVLRAGLVRMSRGRPLFRNLWI